MSALPMGGYNPNGSPASQKPGGQYQKPGNQLGGGLLPKIPQGPPRRPPVYMPPNPGTGPGKGPVATSSGGYTAPTINREKLPPRPDVPPSVENYPVREIPPGTGGWMPPRDAGGPGSIPPGTGGIRPPIGGGPGGIMTPIGDNMNPILTTPPTDQFAGLNKEKLAELWAGTGNTKPWVNPGPAIPADYVEPPVTGGWMPPRDAGGPGSIPPDTGGWMPPRGGYNGPTGIVKPGTQQPGPAQPGDTGIDPAMNPIFTTSQGMTKPGANPYTKPVMRDPYAKPLPGGGARFQPPPFDARGGMTTGPWNPANPEVR